MTLEEALEVADRVERSSDWVVMAIGRFMMPTEIHDAIVAGTLEKHPWMVSIMCRHDVTTYTKITSLEDWFDWQTSERATKATKPATKPAIRESKPAVPETPRGMLF